MASHSTIYVDLTERSPKADATFTGADLQLQNVCARGQPLAGIYPCSQLSIFQRPGIPGGDLNATDSDIRRLLVTGQGLGAEAARPAGSSIIFFSRSPAARQHPSSFTVIQPLVVKATPTLQIAGVIIATN